jgi:hypothetical protein
VDATTITNEKVPSPSWAQMFFGIITNPIATFKELDAFYETAPVYTLTQQAFNTVFITALLLGMARFNPEEAFLSLYEILSVITNEMVIWVVSACLLSMLSTILSNARPVRWKKALVLTGWSFTPLIFFAPLMCFKNALGAWVLPIATVPTWWTLFLLFTSYKIALNVRTSKLLVVALLMPPLLFLVYMFWTGLSLMVLLSELISAFQR